MTKVGERIDDQRIGVVKLTIKRNRWCGEKNERTINN
jgi:hypothetical protein